MIREKMEMLSACGNKDGYERTVCTSFVLEGTIMGMKRRRQRGGQEDKQSKKQKQPTRTSVVPAGQLSAILDPQGNVIHDPFLISVLAVKKDF